MRIPFIFVSLILLTAPLHADPLEDLRVFLSSHPGQSTIRLRVAGEFQQVVERRHKPAASLPSHPVSLRVSDGASGFQVTWDSGSLAEAAERNPAEDLGLTLPNLAHASTAWLDPICLARTANPIRSIQRLLQVAKVKEVKECTWNGRPAQRLVLGIESPVPEQYRHRANTTEGTMILWVAPGGAPLASEVTLQYQGRLGRMFGDFSRFTVQKAIYGVTQDRVFSTSQSIEDRMTVEWDITRTVLNLKAEEDKP